MTMLGLIAILLAWNIVSSKNAVVAHAAEGYKVVLIPKLVYLGSNASERTPKLERLLNQASSGADLVAFAAASSDSGEDGYVAIFKSKE